MVRRIFPCRGSQDADGGKYLLGKGDQEAAEQTQKALGALAGIVGLDGHTDLDDAPAQDDDADGPDRGEDEVGQVVDDGERVCGGQGRDGAKRDRQHSTGPCGENAGDLGEYNHLSWKMPGSIRFQSCEASGGNTVICGLLCGEIDNAAAVRLIFPGSVGQLLFDYFAESGCREVDNAAIIALRKRVLN